MNPTEMPSTSASVVELVSWLMFFIKASDLLFTRKALSYLEKKLKKRSNSGLEKFLGAVASNGSNMGDCVTMPRTKDGRIHISSRMVVPEVVFTRILRSPDADEKAARHRGCQVDPQNVCVNPWHYDVTEDVQVVSDVPPRVLRSRRVMAMRQTSPKKVISGFIQKRRAGTSEEINHLYRRTCHEGSAGVCFFEFISVDVPRQKFYCGIL